MVTVKFYAVAHSCRRGPGSRHTRARSMLHWISGGSVSPKSSVSPNSSASPNGSSPPAVRKTERILRTLTQCGSRTKGFNITGELARNANYGPLRVSGDRASGSVLISPPGDWCPLKFEARCPKACVARGELLSRASEGHSWRCTPVTLHPR